jgi:hypothetical protein
VNARLVQEVTNGQRNNQVRGSFRIKYERHLHRFREFNISHITDLYVCIHRQYVRRCLMCLYSHCKKNTAGDCVVSKTDMHWGFYINRINGIYETNIYPVQMAHVQVSTERKQQGGTETSVQAAFILPLSWDSIVCISDLQVEWLMDVVWFQAGARNVYILQVVQTDPGAHPASYLRGTKRLLPHGEAVE